MAMRDVIYFSSSLCCNKKKVAILRGNIPSRKDGSEFAYDSSHESHPVNRDRAFKSAIISDIILLLFASAIYRTVMSHDLVDPVTSGKIVSCNFVEKGLGAKRPLGEASRRPQRPLGGSWCAREPWQLGIYVPHKFMRLRGPFFRSRIPFANPPPLSPVHPSPSFYPFLPSRSLFPSPAHSGIPRVLSPSTNPFWLAVSLLLIIK